MVLGGSLGDVVFRLHRGTWSFEASKGWLRRSDGG